MKKFTKEEIETILNEYQTLWDEGYRNEVIYAKMKTSKQRMHQLKKRLEEYNAN